MAILKILIKAPFVLGHLTEFDLCELSDRRALQILMTQTPMKDFLEIYDLEFPPAPGTDNAMMDFVNKFHSAVALYLINPIPISSAFDELKSMKATIKTVQMLSDITDSYVELEDEHLYDGFQINMLESMIESLEPMKNQIIVFFGAGAVGRLAIAMAHMLPNNSIKILEPSHHLIEQTNIRGEMTKKYMHFFGQQSHAVPIISANFLSQEFHIPILADVIIFNTQFERHEEFSGLWKKIYQCERPIQFFTDQLLRCVCFENTPTGHLSFENKRNPESSEELPSCPVLPIAVSQGTIDEKTIKKDAETQTASKKLKKINVINNLSEIPIIPGRKYNFRPRNRITAINQANPENAENSEANEIHLEASQMVHETNHNEIQNQPIHDVIGNGRNYDDAHLEINQLLNGENGNRQNTLIFGEEMINEEAMEPWQDEDLREAMARPPNSVSC
ncbi:unnamed protein product [Caenorhabditis nigoni]